MRFGRIPVGEALGAVVGHTLRLGAAGGGLVLKKGRVLSAADLDALRAAGHDIVVAARMEATDVAEDAAAARVAAAIAGAGLQAAEATTGRCNLHAASAGVFLVDRARVDGLNATDEAITVATIAPHAPVRAGDLVATVKVIPFAVDGRVVDACAAAGQGALAVAGFRAHAAGLVLTRPPGVAEVVLDRAAAAQRLRVERLGGTLLRELRCAHDEESVARAIAELAAAGCSPILVLGASAIVDRRDVVPAAIELAGGAVEHLGMPVDPGNLLLVGRRGATPIVGVPGCARSLRRSGFDAVLERLAAGLPVGRAEVSAMGVGGLLVEIPARPHPRAPEDGPPPLHPEPQVAAIVLAAGGSRRMGDVNKLLVEIDGAPMVARVTETLLATEARPIVVVTGHDEARVRAAVIEHLGDRVRARPPALRFVSNPAWAEGMSTSLRAGLAELGEDTDGALVCLGDMPRLRAAHVEALLAAFDPADGRGICVPMAGERRGNPVLWAARYFAEMRLLEGDVGARALLAKYAGAVYRVPVDDPGVLLDVDTPEALAALRPQGDTNGDGG